MTRSQPRYSKPRSSRYFYCAVSSFGHLIPAMVLVTKERFLFMKSFALLSFIFYACTQILLELTIVQPKEAAYYPLHDALYFLISIQFALQLVWLRKLFLSPRNPRPLSDFPDSWSPSTSAWNRLNPSELQPAEVIVESLQASYVLLYATCNVCFGQYSYIPTPESESLNQPMI